jgi:hypothetical protein
MGRIIALLFGLTLITACGARSLDKPAVPLGDFNLAHNIVVAPKAQKGPVSREASEEELKVALTKAIADRFDRYEGERLYHFGVSVEGYVLAQPGIPLVLSPKSVMIVNLTVWDDAAGKKLNDKPHQITVFESLSGETVISSGLTQSAEQQLENLAVNVSGAIERYLVKQQRELGWFKGSKSAAAKPAVETTDDEAVEDVVEESVEEVVEEEVATVTIPTDLTTATTKALTETE